MLQTRAAVRSPNDEEEEKIEISGIHNDLL